MRLEIASFCLCATFAHASIELPVTFERNQGQWPESVEYGSHIGGHLYTFAGKWLVIDGTIRVELVSSQNGKLEALDPVGAKTNYLRDRDPRRWVTGVANYGRIRLRNAFPGVDLVFYGSHGQLEFDYRIAPGVSPDLIRFHVVGAGAQVSSGNLRLTTGAGEAIELHVPVAYQETDAGRRNVDCQFSVRQHGEIGFRVAEYDRMRPLLIDPVLIYLSGVMRTGSQGPTESYPPPMVTDADGNFYLGGTTLNGDVTTTPGVLRSTTPCPLVPPSEFYCDDTWVMKFSAKSNSIVWGTYVGHSGATYGQTLLVDAEGNVLLGGYTGDLGFPVTPDAYLSTLPKGVYGGFLAKLNPSGTALVYATYLEEPPDRMKIDSSGAVYYTSGLHLAKMRVGDSTRVYWIRTASPNGGVNEIAIDDTGNLYALGNPSSDFPVTPGAYKTSDNDPVSILKFDQSGNLVFSASFNPMIPTPIQRVLDVGVDSSGNIVFTGIAGSGFPVMNDPDPEPDDCAPTTPCMAYVAALDSTGSKLVYARLLGHGQGEKLAFDSAGGVYVAGSTGRTPFPRTLDAFRYCSNPPGPSSPSTASKGLIAPENGFIVHLDSQGNRTFSSYLGTTFPVLSHLRLAADGTLFLGGTLGGYIATTVPPHGGTYFVEVIDTSRPEPVPHACLVNATQNVGDSDQSDLYVAPGEMVTLFGEGLGPDSSASAQWNSDGSLSTSLAGAQVLFDGIAAPMLYAQANQINCIVPFGIAASKTTTVVAQYSGMQTSPMTFHVAPAILNAFTKGYWPGSDAIAINQDGTMNSAEAPAPRGSIVTFFLIGGGQTNPPIQDGQIVPGAATLAASPVYAGFFDSAGGGHDAQIEYAGAAPGQIAGVYQMNVKVPQSTATGHTYVELSGNNFTASYAGIWIQ